MSDKKDEALIKNWKDKMRSVVGAAIVAAAPATTTATDAIPAKEITAHTEAPLAGSPKELDVPLGKHPIDKFLKPIGWLESSGGRNTAHTPQSTGIHAGTTAMGTYALMPATVQNVAGMLNNKNSNLRQLLNPHYRDMDVEQFHNMEPQKIQQKLENDPSLRLRIARYLALHLHKLHNGDTARAAFGWRFGHNRPSDKISDRELEHSGYVKKFKQLYGQDK